MPKLLQSIPEGPLAIIGDIHGEIDALDRLLTRLGHRHVNGGEGSDTSRLPGREGADMSYAAALGQWHLQFKRG